MIYATVPSLTMAPLRQTAHIAPVWSPCPTFKQATTSSKSTSTETSTAAAPATAAAPTTDTAEATAPALAPIATAETEVFLEPVSLRLAPPILEVLPGPGRYYYAPYTITKALPEYNQRVKPRLKMMHCAACGADHHRFLLSYSHRHADSRGKRGQKCVVRKGY